MPQTPAPTRANVRQSATWRISDTNLSPPCQLTTHAADSMLFLSKSRLFGFLPTKFPEYPSRRRNLAWRPQSERPKRVSVSSRDFVAASNDPRRNSRSHCWRSAKNLFRLSAWLAMASAVHCSSATSEPELSCVRLLKRSERECCQGWP